MSELEDRIRAKAHELWVAEGRPEGRHDIHWIQAREIVALEDAEGPPTRPLAETIDEPVEPAIAFENQGEFPDLTDRGDHPAGPELAEATQSADERPRSVDAAAPRRSRRSATATAEAAPRRRRGPEPGASGASSGGRTPRRRGS